MTLLAVVARDFRRTWPQLVLTDLLSRAVAVMVLAPSVGLLLRLFLTRAPGGVLKDEEILQFLRHPAGIAAAVIVGAVLLGILFAEQGALMVIGFAAAEDRRATYLDAIRYVAARFIPLVKLGGTALVRLLLLAAPFGAALGGLYLLLLREHDINFYLTRRPPELWTAALLSGSLLAALGVLLLRRLAAWLLSVPLVLFEAGTGPGALRASQRATAGHRGAMAWLLIGWVVAVLASSWVVSWLLGGVGGFLRPHAAGNLAALAVGLALVLVLAGAATLALNLLAATWFALLVVRLYLRMAGPGTLIRPIAERGSLGERPALRIPGKGIVAAAATGLALVLLGGYLAARHAGAKDHAVIIAHRGASGHAPENSMAAFRRAIRDRADWIELDVQESADGEVVVTHDSDFMKIAGVPLKVWDATAADLAAIDIGGSFGPMFAGQRVPTLREVLELARGRIGVLIELKYYGRDRSLEARVADLVEETGMEDDIVIMSLKRAGLQKMAELRPGWTYGLLATVSVGDLTRLDLDFLAVNAAAATPSFIRRAHRRGLRVYAWTINDPVQMSVMMSRGVDGLITDHPDLARQVKELREGLGPIGRVVVWAAGEAGLLPGVEEESGEGDA